ncbi:MAG TPA: O-antigen ligase family protein [Tepidisphaeraceae bacterium]|nr:O-antigen ligase family protein [Tepidisphaeraceae bacterium]
MLALGVCLLGYALAGRGFAYVGVSPLFVGELCLAGGLLTFLLTRGWSRVLHVGAAIAVVPLAAWGFVRLAQGFPQYKIDAVRDAVVWGYAAFGLVVAGLIVAEPRRLPRLLRYYSVFTRAFLIGIPIAFFTYRYGRWVIPAWPGSEVPIVQVKEGDALVHLSGILAFWMADPKRNVRWIWATLLTLDMALMGVIDRAGLVSFGAVMIICLIAKPLHGAAWRTIAMLALGAVLLWAARVDIEVPGGKGRNISWEQFVESGKSIFGEGSSSAAESNKQWRLDWWKSIVDYTVHGPYFWTGKGFGINLADDDGFQVSSEGSLRSPHSVHMTVLARMGVPGLVLWITMIGVWVFSMFDAYLRCRRRGQQRWAGAFLFLLAYYLAFVINGSFDVFIEGPMGGIWFWSLYGAGVGALWAWRRAPHVLADDADADNDDGGSASAGGMKAVHEGPGRAQLLPAAGGRGRRLPVGAGAARIAGP